jgi:hypothetical protein
MAQRFVRATLAAISAPASTIAAGRAARIRLFPLRLQPEFDQATDGFGAGGVVILAPCINLLGQICRETHGTDGIDSALLFRTAARFLVYGN